MSEMRDQARERDWDHAGHQVDEWVARYRAERDARYRAADARQDERDDEIRDYIRDMVRCEAATQAVDSYAHVHGSIGWYLRNIADDE